MIPAPGELPSSVPFQNQNSDSSNVIGLIIADDHQLFNDGVKVLLSSETDIAVLEQVYNGDEVEESVQRLKPDLILLDINLPGKDGLQLSSILKKTAPHLKVILLSMYSDRQFIQKARQVNVDGYLLKTASKQELLDSIRQVKNGKQCFMVKENTECLHGEDEFIKKLKLTKREQEIIKLVVDGQSSQSIAEKLFLSVFTVETHRRNINLKLGIKNVAELINIARTMGL